MKCRLRKIVPLVGLLIGCWSLAVPAAPAVAPAQAGKPVAVASVPSTTTPVARDDKSWMNRHLSMNARVKKGHVDMIFIGDSITNCWENRGKSVWQEYYGNRNAVNLGIGGDRTQHVLWRLKNGNIEGISPKLAVLMIGTNNASSHDTPAQIADGVQAILSELRCKLPSTKILILGIFPRGGDNHDPLRQVNVKTNALLETMADGKSILYQDIGPKFLTGDTLPKTIMPDLLHPNEAGYKIWATAIEPTVAETVGPK
jgi:beta-glucosidase